MGKIHTLSVYTSYIMFISFFTGYFDTFSFFKGFSVQPSKSGDHRSIEEQNGTNGIKVKSKRQIQTVNILVSCH